MATARRLRYEDGAVAIYDIDTSSPNDNPLTNPAGNISRLHFHSDLPSPAIIKTNGQFSRTGTINLGSVSSNGEQILTHGLFEHGRPGIPLVFGRITIDGSVTVSLNGSVPLDLDGGDFSGQFVMRSAHLGADDTEVYIRTWGWAGFAASMPARTLAWEVYVTNVTLEGTDPGTGDDTLLTITPEYMSAGLGKFDSRNRYIRVASSGALINMVKGKTADISPRVSPGLEPSIRFNLGSYTREFGDDPGSHTTVYTPMKF